VADVGRIERQVELHAPREEVWAALTRPDRLSSWFGGEAEVEVRPGGRLTITSGGRIRRGLVEAVDPPGRLSFRWLPDPGDASGPRTRVELTLEDSGSGTRLTVVERSLWGPSDPAELDESLAEAR
jgi:uncharacterized protein YndB with AHSA1/START domain